MVLDKSPIYDPYSLGSPGIFRDRDRNQETIRRMYKARQRRRTRKRLTENEENLLKFMVLIRHPILSKQGLDVIFFVGLILTCIINFLFFY